MMDFVQLIEPLERLRVGSPRSWRRTRLEGQGGPRRGVASLEAAEQPCADVTWDVSGTCGEDTVSGEDTHIA